jgi:hypothetical protein
MQNSDLNFKLSYKKSLKTLLQVDLIAQLSFLVLTLIATLYFSIRYSSGFAGQLGIGSSALEEGLGYMISTGILFSAIGLVYLVYNRVENKFYVNFKVAYFIISCIYILTNLRFAIGFRLYTGIVFPQILMFVFIILYNFLNYRFLRNFSEKK